MEDGGDFLYEGGAARARVLAFAVRRLPGAPAKEFGLDRLPLAPAWFSLDIDGVPTAVASALRRTVTDEMWGYALEVPTGAAASANRTGYIVNNSSDPLMRTAFVIERVGLIPLAPGISPEVVSDLVLGLHVKNDSPTVRYVYSGDFEREAGPEPEGPLFNPTFELAVLQPGRSLELRAVRIRRGFGDAKFNNAARVASFPLDLEQYPDDEMRREGGSRADESGFVLSSSVANPRSHRVRGCLVATTERAAEEVRALFAEACAVLCDRLRAAAAALGVAEGPAFFAAATVADGLREGVLRIAGETDSLGGLITRYAHERHENLALVNYDVGPGAGGALRVLVRSADEDPAAVLKDSIDALIELFGGLREEIHAARISSKLPWDA